ncbi:hypothetical protein ACQEVB_09355 [Pseudonocardia sp. CA-107938]|uniref:hypothetical protein n=1 Tax=Pseudonocardia sp. CA-107938 TaxID=3240021 RepID=UPI003D8B2251
MTEDDIRALLATAAGPDPGPVPVDRIVAAGRRRARRVRIAQLAGTVAVVAGIAGAVWAEVPDRSLPTAASTCSPVEPAVLPDWARGGFSEPEPVMPYVLGERGEIVAILWTDLHAPAPAGRTNKILWVAKDHSPEPMTITARLGTTTVTSTMQQGPGPSTFDVPGPGCWTFVLRWGRNQDTLVLPYRG